MQSHNQVPGTCCLLYGFEGSKTNRKDRNRLTHGKLKRRKEKDEAEKIAASFELRFFL